MATPYAVDNPPEALAGTEIPAECRQRIFELENMKTRALALLERLKALRAEIMKQIEKGAQGTQNLSRDLDEAENSVRDLTTLIGSLGDRTGKLDPGVPVPSDLIEDMTRANDAVRDASGRIFQLETYAVLAVPSEIRTLCDDLAADVRRLKDELEKVLAGVNDRLVAEAKNSGKSLDALRDEELSLLMRRKGLVDEMVPLSTQPGANTARIAALKERIEELEAEQARVKLQIELMDRSGSS